MNTKFPIPVVGCLVLFSFSLVPEIHAGGAGGVVAAGNATITGIGAPVLNINQTSSRAVIDWSSFNLNSSETANFHFQNPNGAVLNVIGGGQSVINGALNSFVGSGSTIGGTVYLLNPNGILIGPSGSIHAGSFGATTLGIDNASFMNGGTLTFGRAGATPPGAVQNLGTISALGDVFLMANTVQNAGTINAGGTAGLAAGTEITLASSGAERLTVVAGGTGGAVGVDNTVSGRINAVTAELKAAGGNIYALAINNGGAIRANALVKENGHVYLRADGGDIQNSGTISAQNGDGSGGSIVVDGGHNDANPSAVVNTGTIDASGTTGGSVQVTGDNIGLASGSVVNVSGVNGGGTALIGGGAHGTDASVQDAEQTSVASGAIIDAGALTLGNGGSVVVWGNQNSFVGSINARGGANGGNGGTVEVSGKQLSFAGLVDTRAPNGKVGNLLLDPTDLTVDNGSDNNVTANSPFTPTGDSSEITWGTIEANLLLGDVTVSTVGSADIAGETGKITIAASPTVAINSTQNLSFTAAGDIDINAPVQQVGTGTLTFQAGGGIAVNANVISSGDVIMTHVSPITGPAFIETPLLELSGPGNVGTSANPLNSAAQEIEFNEGSGVFIAQNTGISVDIAGTVAGLNMTGPAITIDAAGISGASIALNNIGLLGGSGTISGGTLTLVGSGNVGSSGSPLSTSVNAIVFGEARGINFISQDVNKTVDLSGTLAGDLTLSAGAMTMDTAALNAGGGNINLTGTTLDLGQNVTTTGTVALNNSKLVSESGGQITAGTLDLNGSGNVGSGGNPLGTSVNAIVFGETGGINFISQDVNKTVDLSGTLVGDLTLSAGAMTMDTAALNAGGGDINLTGTTLDLGQNVTTTGAVALNNSGLASESGGQITATALDLNGSGNVGSGGNPLGTSVNAIVFGETGGINFISQDVNKTVDLSGTLAGDLTLSAGAMTMDTAALNAGGGNINLTGTTLDLGQNVTTTGTVALNNSKLVSESGGQITAGTLDLNGSGNVGGSGAAIKTSVNTLAFGGGGGSATVSQDGNKPLDIFGNTGNGSVEMATGPANTVTIDPTFDLILGAGTFTLDSGVLVSGGAPGQGFLSANTLAINGGSAGTGSEFLNTAVQNIQFSQSGGGDDFIAQNTGITATLSGITSGNLTINGANLAINGFQAKNATFDNTGTLSGSGLTAGTLTLDGSGNVGSGGNPLGTSVNAIVFGETGGINFISQDVNKTVDLSGTLAGDLTLSAGAMTMDTAALNAGGGNINLTGTTLDLGQNVTTTGTVALNNSKLVSESGGQITAGTLDLNGSGNVGGSGAAIKTSVNTLAFGGGGGSATVSQDGNKPLDIFGNTGNGSVEMATGPANTVTIDPTFDLILGAGTFTLDSGVLVSGGAPGQGFLSANTLAINGGSAGTGSEFLNTAVQNIQFSQSGGGDDFIAQNTGITATLSGITSGNLTINGANLAINGFQAKNATFDNTGTLSGSGLTAGTLTLDGSGNVGSGGNPLGTSVNAIVFGETGGINFISQDVNKTVDLSGTLAGDLTLSAGAMTMDTAALNAGGGNINLTGTTLDLGQNVTTTGTVALNNSKLVSESGGQITAGTLDLNGSGDFGTSSSLVNTKVSTILLGVSGPGGGNDFINQDPGTTVDIGGNSGGGSVTLVSGPATIDAEGLIFGNGVLTLDTTGTLGGPGAIVGSGLTLEGNAAVGTALNPLNTAVSDITFQKGGGDSFIAQNTGITATLSGVTSGNLTINGGNLAINGFQAKNATFDNAGTLSGSGLTAGTLTLDGSGNVGSGGNPLGTSVNAIVFGETGGINFISQDVNKTVDLSGTLVGDLTLSAGAMTMDTAALNAGGGDINLTGTTLDLGQNVTTTRTVALNNSKLVSESGGQITAGTLDLNGSGDFGTSSSLVNTKVSTIFLGVSGPAGGNDFINQDTTEAVDISGATGGGSVTLSAGATTVNNGPLNAGAGNVTLNTTTLTLAQNVTGAIVTVNNSGTATITGAQSGAGQLQFMGSGNLVTQNSISAGSLVDNETTDLNSGSVTTAGDQSYTQPVSLSANAKLTSTTIEMVSVNLNSFNLTLNNNSTATMAGAVAGTGQLAASGTGNLLLNNTVSVGSVNDSEATTLNNGNVTTTGDQSYTGALTLGAPATLTASTIELAGVTGGGFSLTLDNSGQATLNQTIAGLSTLTANSPVTLNLNGGSVTTSGDQNYTGTVTLASAAALNSGTLEMGPLTGNFPLTLNNSGLAKLSSVTGVGAISASGSGSLALNGAFSSASLNDGEPTALNNGSVTTTGDQKYTAQLSLATAATLTAPTIELAGVAGNNFSLTLDNSAAASFNGTVAGLNTLTVNGPANLNGGAVTTTGDQNYKSTVSLGAVTTLTSSTLELGQVTGNNFALTLNNSGLAKLSGITGAGAVSANGSGSLVLNSAFSSASLSDNEATTLNNGNVTTTGDQNYTKTLTLGTASQLTGGTIELAGVTGGNFNLQLNDTTSATLNGPVSAVNLFTATGVNATLTINNSVKANQIVAEQNNIAVNGPITTTGNAELVAGVTSAGNNEVNVSGGGISLNGSINAGGTVEIVAGTGGISQSGGAAITANKLELGSAQLSDLFAGANQITDNNVSFFNGKVAGNNSISFLNVSFLNAPQVDFPNPANEDGNDLFFSQQLAPPNPEPLVSALAALPDISRYVTVYLPPVLLGTDVHVEAPEPDVVPSVSGKDGYLVRSVQEIPNSP